MARNVFLGGAQTTPTKPKGRGPGLNRNNGPRGGNGGGPGGNRTPRGGLYQGKAGEAASNQAPDVFFQSALRQAGLINDSGTEFDTWARDQAVQDLMGRYNAAVGMHQNMSAEDFLKKQYGTRYAGKQGNRFKAGTLSSVTGPLADRYQTFTANQNPQGAINTDAMNRGLLPSNGNDDFATWYQTTFAPRLEGEWNQAKGNGAPQTNINDWLRAQDLTARAQRQYANRPPSQRQLSPYAPVGGRWSWWS